MIDDTATIYLRVPAATKGRWVRESRQAGLRLTDWITRAVEAQHPEIEKCHAENPTSKNPPTRD